MSLQPMNESLYRAETYPERLALLHKMAAPGAWLADLFSDSKAMPLVLY
jgi:hypothetical protein